MNIHDLIKHIVETPNFVNPLDFNTIGESIKNELQMNHICIDLEYIDAIHSIARRKLKQLTKEEVYPIWVESYDFSETDNEAETPIEEIKKHEMHDDIIISLEQLVLDYLHENIKKHM